MRKTLLIARREYLAFVRTVGFWMSLVTLPLIIASTIAVPFLLRTTTPQKDYPVAILDLSGGHIAPDLEAIVRAHGPQHGPLSVARAMAKPDLMHLVPLPPGVAAGGSLDETERTISAVLARRDAPDTNVLVTWEDGDSLHVRIWAKKVREDGLQSAIGGDLNRLQALRMAASRGIDRAMAQTMLDAAADVTSRAPAASSDGLSAVVQDQGPRILGAMTGYMCWMTIFSSSMILLSGVIEEKSSKVLEVLLASASTESLLVGKVLGVAAVMLTVGLIWTATAIGLGSFGASFISAGMAVKIHAVLANLFSPVQVALMLVYFFGGYLMFGVTFAAIGAFCETQKDAQAIMGPIMIVLMIPMLCMQAAFTAPDSPLIPWLSYVPVFTPFLMPLRLAQPLPLWEIALTLFDMFLVAVLMINLGRRAFKHGALTGGKLTWGTVFRLAAGK